ncbi:flagellar filament capping protein FliD [Azonexus sp.]|jgi:flagellar hook-associated protein 2|uniref:flagellar filament capping protein FliD n=1 Tax=Azonexus sp. TaxID=1872668 RepID=UPI002829EE99|nr:flagellar filament capping protein FliD [Azonexus sp.]MDR1995087.1 flagellar filament capping protein FliD [Azonexus sp.]
MAGTISSLGVGSGIDSNSIVAKLMALEQIPLKMLQARESAFNAKLSIFGQLKSSLSALQTAAKALSDPSKLGGLAATVGNKDILSAKVDFFASAGTYSVNVISLATAQRRYSETAYTGGTQFGSGTLTFTVGGEERQVAIGDGASLNDIRAAINGANIGVTASIISGDGGDRLVLTGANTGSGNGFELTVDSTDANLQSLANFNLAHPFNSDAGDAQVQIDGELVTSSSNTLTAALTGVTLTLSQVGTTQVTVARDSSKATEAVNAFVKAFNDVVTLIKNNSTFDSATQTGKPLNAESAVRSVLQMLGDARTQTPSSIAGSPFESLASLGISITKDGLLEVDSAKLDSAITSSFSDVQKTLGAFGQSFSDRVEQLIGTNGLVTNRVDGINRSIRMLQDDQERMQLRLDSIEKRYRAQFTALDTLMASLQTTSLFLTQQLASLNNNR